ncbi:hypothetical protein M3J09_006057 [Ascochyta lentis]
MDSNELDFESPPSMQSGIVLQGGMDHVLDMLASHDHPLTLIACSAQRWMVSAGTTINSCDLLARNDTPESIASELVETRHWEFRDPGTQVPEEPYPSVKYDANLVLRRIEMERHESEY